MEQLREAMLEIQRLVADQSLDSKERFDSIAAKVSEVFDAKNPEWNERLLYFAEATSSDLSEIVRDEYEKRITQSKADSEGKFAELNALPVLFLNNKQDIERAGWIDLLPRLPSGQRIPILSDLLFSWGDIVGNQHVIWRILNSIKNNEPIAGSDFHALKEGRMPNGTFDPIIFDMDTQASLRFLICYRSSSEPSFFQDVKERSEWASNAMRVFAERGIDIRAPRKMSEAMYVADGMAKFFYSRNLVNYAIAQGCDPRNVFLLAEDFGHAQKGTSGYLRLSVCVSSPENWIKRTAVFRPLPSDRARWRHGNEQFRISCAAAGISTLIVDHIQSAKLIEEPNCVRLHLIFGPSVAFTEAAPDGYPVDIFVHPSIDAITKKWLDYDFESLPTTYNLVKALLEALIEGTQVADAEMGFVLRDGRWRPSLIIDLLPKPPETLDQFRGRINEVFDYVLSYLQLNAAVAWINHEILPSSKSD